MQITSHDRLQRGYTYECTKKSGVFDDPTFKPDLIPQQMLELGVFGGNYFEGEHREFPKAWFKGAQLSVNGEYDAQRNFFRIRASQSREIWMQKGWIHKDDPRGWFQWYCRYYLGRRHSDDMRQISRWSKMTRHIRRLQNACPVGELSCRPRQRQALLHWAYDSRRL